MRDPVPLNTKGRLAWRCKRCGEVVQFAFACIAQGVIDELEMHHGLGSHTCGDGSIGVTQLIGANADPRETP